MNPEAALAAYRWRLDPDTLREVADDREELWSIRAGLTAALAETTEDSGRARLYGLRSVVARGLGDIDAALSDATDAVDHAELTGSWRRLAVAQLRLANAYRWQNDHATADRLFALANSDDLPNRLRAAVHLHAGGCSFEQNRYLEAFDHLERALALRGESDLDVVDTVEQSLDVIIERIAAKGIGPYRRSRAEVLGLPPPPQLRRHRTSGRWGFQERSGRVLVPPVFVEALPYHEGVAWVRKRPTENWELVDERGAVVIPVDRGYPAVSLFSEGLAWVRGEQTNGWVAIDRNGRVAIGANGFTEPRPFRAGIAVARQGQYFGVIDTAGKPVVPFAYNAVCTAAVDGRYTTGFTGEGLAVIDREGRRGVVDRAGRMLVPPRYRELYIHPVAYVILRDNSFDRWADSSLQDDLWGALDRQGELLIEPRHETRAEVVDALDAMLKDDKPVL